MKFDDLDTKTPAEKGAFCHLRHSKWDHLLYTGPGADEHGRLVDEKKKHEPVGVTLRGLESPSMRKIIDKVQMQHTRKPQEMTAEKMGLIIAKSLILNFHGIEKDGAPMEATDENKIQFLNLSDNLIGQIRKFAEEQDNFFEKLPDV